MDLNENQRIPYLSTFILKLNALEPIYKEHFELLSNQLQITLSSGVVCTWIVELPSYEVIGDQVLFEFFGLPYDGKGSLPLKFFTDSMHIEDRERVLNKIEEAISNRTPYEAEYRINEENPRWVLASGKVDNEIAPTKFLGFIVDISQKKASEAALKVSEESFHLMTSLIPQQVWTAKANGQLDFVNTQACLYFGKTMDEVVGAGWTNVVHPSDLPGALLKWSAALSSGITYETQFRLLDKSGNYRWHLARAIPYVQDDKVLKWFGTNTDIEDQNKINQKKDDFIGIASHELKTPVTSLKAALQLLGKLSPGLPDHIQRLISQSNKSMDNVHRLLDSLLNVSRMNEGQLHLDKTTFLIAAHIYECCNDILEGGKHILNFDADEDILVTADQLRIGQVVINLVNNAVKYAPDSEMISVSVKKQGSAVKISVTDAGPGIPGDRLPYLFNRYYRVENSEKLYSGLGLGLYINSEIIKSHEGEIGVTSAPGRGSSFWFTLPL